MDVFGWLRDLGLSQYEAAFRENAIDEDVLPRLTSDDLKEIGVGPVGHRRRILDAIAGFPGETNRSTAAIDETHPAAFPMRPPRDSAERRPITVMFCDLVGSTSLAAKLDAEDWRDLVGAYLDEASKAVTQYGGHVLKKLGDGLMALFGYPKAQENDAERAARAGLAILCALEELNGRNASRGAPALAARIGLESGPVVVDTTGEVFGDAPNVAARVQSAADPGTLFVTAGVQRQVAGLFVAEDKGPHELKGLQGKPTLYRLVRTSGGGRRTGTRSLTPLVGREEELATLARRWERTKAGDGQFVQIVGEPGLGKSRLIEEFRLRLGETPHTWVEWTSSQLLQNTPLHPIAEWGRQRFTGEARFADLEAALAQAKLDPTEFAPLLAPLLDITTPADRVPQLAADELRRRQLAATASWITAGARAQPLVLAVEDLHWADPSTLDLMKAFAERGGQAPLFIVTTSRPEFRAPWAMRANHSIVGLAPLDRAQIAQMVGALAERHALSHEAIEGLSDRTAGVPLFIEELTRLMLEGGAQTIPPTLQQSLAARLDRLGDAREVAQIGAVLGREFSRSLLKEVAQLLDQVLDSSLEKLAEADLLFADGIAPGATYRFKHALIQDAAYESMLKARRQALHRRAAGVLLADPDPQPELIAHHFAQAGESEHAIEWWGKAGDAALRRSAFQEAISHLGKAIEMADRSEVASRPQKDAPTSPAAQRMKLQTAYSHATMMASGFATDETKAAFERASDLSAKTGNFAERFAAAHGKWTLLLVRGELRAARALASEYLKEAEDAQRLVEAGVARRGLGLASLLAADFIDARTHCERAFALCDPELDQETRSVYNEDNGTLALSCLAVAEWELGALARGRELIEKAIRRAQDLGHPPSMAHPLQWLSFLELRRGDAAAALLSAEALADLGRKHAMPFWALTGGMFAALARGRAHDAARGTEELRLALSTAVEQGRGPNSMMTASLAELEAETLGLDRALARIDEAESIAVRGEHRLGLPGLHFLRGELLLRRNPSDRGGAEQSYRTALEISEQQRARTYALSAALSLAKLCRSTGRFLEAHDVLAPALAGFTVTPELPAIAEAQELLAALESGDALKGRRRDQRIRAQYAKALMIAEGYTAAPTEAAFREVRIDASSFNDDEAWTQLFGRWTQSVFRADLTGAARVAEEQVNFAEAAGNMAMAAAGHRMLCTTLILRGSFNEARRHGEIAVAMYDESSAASYRVATGADFKVGADIFLAIACWATGDFERASDLTHSAISRAEGVDPVYSLVMGLAQALFPLAYARLPDPALEIASRALKIAVEHKIGAWELHLRLYDAWARGRLDGPATGAAELRSVWDAMRERGLHFYDSLALRFLADLAFAGGELEEALDLIAQGLEVAYTTDAVADLSGLLRMRGEILIDRDPAAAEQAFKESIAIARRQGGRAFEVMAAASFGKLLVAVDRTAEAQDVLTTALNGLRPSSACPAVAAAQALLATCRS